MRRIVLPLAAAVVFGAAPFASKLGVVSGSAVLVVLGVLLALGASGTFSSLAIAAGALGAFAGNVLGSVTPAVGGAVLVGLAFAERTTRVRGTNARIVHIGSSLLVGALAGSLATAYASASPAVRGVAILVCAVLVALPLLVDADDPLAAMLESASLRVSDPARASLRDAAELRRQVHDVPLDADARAGVTATWSALKKLAESRMGLERTKKATLVASPSTVNSAVVAMLDQRIADHVAALARTYTAVDTAHAAAASLDNGALAHVENASESLEEASRVLVDMK